MIGRHRCIDTLVWRCDHWLNVKRCPSAFRPRVILYLYPGDFPVRQCQTSNFSPRRWPESYFTTVDPQKNSVTIVEAVSTRKLTSSVEMFSRVLDLVMKRDLEKERLKDYHRSIIKLFIITGPYLLRGELYRKSRLYVSRDVFHLLYAMQIKLLDDPVGFTR